MQHFPNSKSLTKSIALDPIPSACPMTSEALRAMSCVRHFKRDQEVFGQDERCDNWYAVVSGAVREYVVRSDGRRQIIDILLPGDFFGFTLRTHRWFGVQAVADDTTLECYSRQRVEALADIDPCAAKDIRARCFQAIERLEEQMLVVGTMTAQEKVRGFLSYFCDRMAATQDDDAPLPISRYDIADMLGISVETVCRAFTDLQERGVIAMQGPRRIKIMKRDQY